MQRSTLSRSTSYSLTRSRACRADLPLFIPLVLQVYYIAKQCKARCSVEEYAIALARHFVETYPKVWCSIWTDTDSIQLQLHQKCFS